MRSTSGPIGIAVILSEAKDPTWQRGRWPADGSSMVERSTYHVYIVTGLSLSRVLYVGVTSDLPARIEAHRRKKADGFTARYQLWRLVYAEAFTYVRDAIAREKQLKGWRRDRKVALIETVNPGWNELRLDVGYQGGHGVLRFAQDDSKP